MNLHDLIKKYEDFPQQIGTWSSSLATCNTCTLVDQSCRRDGFAKGANGLRYGRTEPLRRLESLWHSWSNFRCLTTVNTVRQMYNQKILFCGVCSSFSTRLGQDHRFKFLCCEEWSDFLSQRQSEQVRCVSWAAVQWFYHVLSRRMGWRICEANNKHQ